jgi:hypothetical protein
MHNVWQHIRVRTDIFARKGTNTREITADGRAFVIDYEGDFSKRFKTQDLHSCYKEEVSSFWEKIKGTFLILNLSFCNNKVLHMS